MSMQAPRDLREWQKAVERKLEAAKGGTRIAIEHGTKAAEAVHDELESYKDLTPAAPIELTVQTSIYVDANKRQRGQAIFDFPDVTFATNGTPITVDRYEIWGQDQGLNPLQPFRLLNTSAISSVYATDLKPGSVWKFKLRARSSAIIKPGLFTADQSVTVTADTVAPPQLSTPTATAVSGGVKVEWDGLAAGGGALPGDFQHAEVAFGMAASPTAIIETFPGKSFTIVPKTAYNQVHYFRLRGVDTSGNVGPWSTQATAIPTPLVDVDIILSQIDAASTVITNIGASSLLAGAVTATKLADNAVTQAKLADQVISLAKLDTTVDAKITKGITDAAAADQKGVNAQLAADLAKRIADAAIASGVNLVINGGFETDDVWPVNSAQSYDTTEKRSGTRSMKLVPSGGNVWPTSNWVDGATGRTYRIEYWIKKSGTDDPVLDSIGCVLQAKTTAGGTATLNVYGTPKRAADISTTGYTRVVVDYTLTTANTVQVRFAPWVRQSTNTYWVDDFTATDITDAKAALDAANQAQIDATKAIGDASIALGAANGKNVITNSIADASAGTPGAASGDRWQKWSSLATGGKLLKTWRWNGTAWIEEALDATYLPLVDIGTGTFGNLNGVRLTANSVSIKSLLVGSFDNVIPDPYFTNANLEWAAASGVYSFPAAEGYGGLSAFKVAAGAGQRGRYSTRVPVEGGSSYRVTAWVKSDVAIPAGALGVYHNHALAGSSTGLSPVNILKQTNGSAGNDAIPANTWTPLVGVAKTNALADTVAFGFFVQSSFTTGNVWFSQASAVRMGDGNLYVDGSITGLAMAANTVTAKNIIVGDFQNFAIGSDFDDAAQVPWTLDPLHTISTAQKKSGTSSLRLGPSASATKSRLVVDLRVKEGEQYYFKLHAYIDAGFNGTADSKLRIGDQSNTYLGAIAFNAITRSAWTTTPLETTVTVPAGVTTLTVELWGNATAGYAYIDDIQIRRVAEPSLIQSLGVEKLTASVAGISQAVIDKLWTDVVMSRKITTDMMIVSGSNLAPDPYFLDDAENAARLASTGTFTLLSDDVSVAKIIRNTEHLAAGSYRSLTLHSVETRIPVIAGDKYTFSFQYRLRGNAVAGQTSQLRFAVYHESPSKTYIRYVGVGNYVNVSGTGTTWTTFTSPEYEIPADVGFIRVVAQFNNAGYTGEFDFKMPRVRAMADAALIVDSGIFARHLTVDDTLWAKVIKFKQLGGDEINVNDLTANTSWIGVMRGGILINDAVTTSVLKADAITAKHTITGATFQTTTTANRGIKFTSAGLNMWDAGGKNTLSADAGTGYLTVTGRLRTAPDGSPGAVLIPPAESNDGKTMALWLAPDVAVLPGGLTAGVWMSNPVGGISTAGEINVRGQSYGGVNLFDEVELMSSDGQIPRIASRHGNGLQMTAYDGNLYFGATTGELRTSSLLNTFINIGTGKQLTLQSGGGAYNRTLSGTANTIIYTDGNVFKVSSASKYKIAPEVMELDDRLLDDVTVKDWIDKGMAERYAESYEHQWPYNEQEQREFDALSLQRIPGTIAEDVEAAGGEKFVVRDLDGEIDSLMYDRLALARTEILKARVAAQAAELAELRGLIEELMASRPA